LVWVETFVLTCFHLFCIYSINGLFISCLITITVKCKFIRKLFRCFDLFKITVYYIDEYIHDTLVFDIDYNLRRSLTKPFSHMTDFSFKCFRSF